MVTDPEMWKCKRCGRIATRSEIGGDPRRILHNCTGRTGDIVRDLLLSAPMGRMRLVTNDDDRNTP